MKLEDIWVVIPAYNESKYIEKVLSRVLAVTSRVVVVDDGSTDKTALLAAKHIPHVLQHSLNLGKGAALKTGCEYVFQQLGGGGVIFFDGDDQHDPELLMTFAQELTHSQAVLGVRSFDTQMPLIRIIMNRVASVLTLILFGKYVPDIPCGYKAITKQTYSKIQWESNDYAVEMEIAARLSYYKIAFAVVSIPTIYHDLDRGMTILDTLTIIPRMLRWRLFI
jgi:glycosyltransferase involved in cell wall biosynthesis